MLFTRPERYRSQLYIFFYVYQVLTSHTKFLKEFRYISILAFHKTCKYFQMLHHSIFSISCNSITLAFWFERNSITSLFFHGCDDSSMNNAYETKSSALSADIWNQNVWANTVIYQSAMLEGLMLSGPGIHIQAMRNNFQKCISE